MAESKTTVQFGEPQVDESGKHCRADDMVDVTKSDAQRQKEMGHEKQS